MANAIVIYTENTTPRHNYVFKLVFNELLGIDYACTKNANNENITINYSNNSKVKGLHIAPIGLLSETEIIPHWNDRIETTKWKNLSIFFQSESEIPFDLFSSIFYCVSRYEEYLDFKPDVHNRFTAEESFLFKFNLLSQPVVNQWVLALKEELAIAKPNLVFKPRKFEYVSTIDIDQAWKFKHKGFIRNLAGTFRDLISAKWENLIDRWPTLLGVIPDAFYNFKWQKEIHSTYNATVKYFILLSDFGGFDKNISYKNSAFNQLILSLTTIPNTEVGIHPSYKSNSDRKQISEEIKRLNNVIGTNVVLSRQHFLMHTMPDTYQNLLALGIKEDHTMGYSTHLGFRAGIAAPFYFFDLTKNEITDLKLYPFCAMDITPLHYMNQKPEEAISTLTALMDKVKAVDGLFISLWHNESFSETERWKGWRIVYEHLLSIGYQK